MIKSSLLWATLFCYALCVAKADLFESDTVDVSDESTVTEGILSTTIHSCDFDCQRSTQCVWTIPNVTDFSYYVCENESLTIDCGGGSIYINGGNFGRYDQYRCINLDKDIYNTTCYSEYSIYVLMKTCQNQQNCTLNANVATFGDPCPGVYKFLSVSYTCIYSLCEPTEPTGTTPTMSTEISTISTTEGTTTEPELCPILNNIGCDYYQTTISCDEGLIYINSANYGRTNESICIIQGLNEEDCYFDATNKLAYECNGRDVCNIPVNSYNFRDTCPVTSKYLEIEYQCKTENCDVIPTTTVTPTTTPTPIRPSYAVACENSTLDLTCPSGSLNILQANYGRTNEFTCCSGPVTNTSCYSEDPYTIVQKTCQGLVSCEMSASTEIFGNPCDGTYKYLEVIYDCE